MPPIQETCPGDGSDLDNSYTHQDDIYIDNAADPSSTYCTDFLSSPLSPLNDGDLLHHDIRVSAHT